MADHFRGKDPLVRQLFDRFRALVKEYGPVTVYAQKTRIVFQARVRFATVVPRKHWLGVGLWLTRSVEHPLIRRIEAIAPRCYGLHFRLSDPADLDEEFAAIVEESYAVGRQEHLLSRATIV